MSEPSGAAMSIPVCVGVRSWVIAPTTGRTYRSSPDGAGAAPTIGVAAAPVPQRKSSNRVVRSAVRLSPAK